MIKISTSNVLLPGYFRAQFRSQFGELLKNELPKLSDLQVELTLEEVWNTFDIADRIIGEHWPLLATKLWKYGTHQLLTSFVETSPNIATALRDVFSESTAYLPVFAASFDPTPECMVVRIRPAFEVKDRHWNILMMLMILGETAFYKRHLPEEAKLITYKTSIPESDYSDTFRKLTTANMNFGFPPEEAHFMYPYSLIGKSVGNRNDRLNKVLLEEIRQTARLPAATDQTLLNLKRLISDRLPDVLPVDAAASELKISRSSLLRLLKTHGQSYRELVTTARREYVLVRLSNIRYEEDYAAKLGFSSVRALNEFCTKNLGYTLRRLLRDS